MNNSGKTKHFVKYCKSDFFFTFDTNLFFIIGREFVHLNKTVYKPGPLYTEESMAEVYG